MESVNNQSSPLRKGSIKTCDIILPTYKRPYALQEALRALQGQRIPSSWQVRIVVCDDGSSSATQGVVDAFFWTGQWMPPLILPLAHLGRSGARNAGIKCSQADIILLLADDILLRSHALALHLEFHDQHQGAQDVALGYVLWDPRIRPTPFMEWMTHGGQQNNYDALLGAKTCDPDSFFYGSHLSIKRPLIQENLFSEKFTAYGWEDLELGSRLKERGAQLHVLHNAIGLHQHFYSAKELLWRQQIIGAQKYRVNTNSIRKLKHSLYWYSGARLCSVYIMKKMGNKVNIPRIFQIIIAGEFWYGVFHSPGLLKRKTL
ncbi:MAG: glycosyltransferase [Candidatus Andersenbacteria bacterium]|nr:glycosyltransferase [Candidatus Andersenbacteria bacterium]